MQDPYDPTDSHKMNNFTKSSNKRIKIADSYQKRYEKIRFIDTPLRTDLRSFIKNIVDEKDSDRILDIIEEVAATEVGDSLFNKLVDNLCSFFEDEEGTKKVVGQILFFKTKPCKNGINCDKISDCVFIHDISKEVVVNHIPAPQHDELMIYCSQFGKISNMKRMNSQKLLVIFENVDDALKFIKSREPVLDNKYIKKFFNKVGSNLNSILAEQEQLIQQVFDNGDKKIALKMKIGLKKLKDAILEI